MRRLVPILIGAAVLALGGAWFFAPGSQSARDLPQLGAANAQTVEAAETLEIEDMTLGEAGAPVQIIEYASYTCPHCRTFHEGAFKELKSEYIDTGLVEFVYREVYFDRFGLWASMVARCGGAERFFGITDLIYGQQSEWTQGQPAEIAANLRRIGLTAGLSEAELDACFSDGEKAQSLVAWYEANAAEDGVRSTPSFIIDGVRYGNMSMTEFREIIDGKL
ncbi:MAG: thioredoxin domain-containing protein [Pseudomonadota bacterium]